MVFGSHGEVDERLKRDVHWGGGSLILAMNPPIRRSSLSVCCFVGCWIELVCSIYMCWLLYVFLGGLGALSFRATLYVFLFILFSYVAWVVTMAVLVVVDSRGQQLVVRCARLLL